MAMHVYFLLLTLCAIFGTSFQQRKTIRQRMNYVEIMLDNIKGDMQMHIYELREAVSLLQNRSEETKPSTEVVPPNAAPAHIESKLKRQNIKIQAISKALADEKTYTRDQMDETKQLDMKLTEQVQELAINLSQTQQINDQLTEEISEVKTDLTDTKQMNAKLTQELHDVKMDLTETKQINTKLSDELNKQMEANKKEILGLITEMHDRITGLHHLSTTTETTTSQMTTQTETPTTTVPEILLTCPDGWKMFQHTCYLHVKMETTWDDAKSRCVHKGGILAEPETQEKLQFLSQIVHSRHSSIGGTDRVREGTWVWNSSGRPVDSSLWMQGQPDNLGNNQDCLGIDYSGGGLRDLTCSYSRDYICEKEATV